MAPGVLRDSMAKFSDLDMALLKRNRRSFLSVFILSGCVNLLMLTGAIYMLQVYDRVLLSRSGSTLFFITLIIMVLYLALYFFDTYRQKMLALIGRDIEEQLAPALFDSGMKLQLRSSEQDRQIWTIRDLEEVGRFLSSAGLMTIFDLPWMPLFVLVCFLFHPLIGLLTIGSIVIVMGLAVAGEIMAKQPTLQLTAARGVGGALPRRRGCGGHGFHGSPDDSVRDSGT
jgi:ABC-type protease/lipase transport system fused ATPase/permease subunit